jgi:hypothetical protein
MSDMPKSIYGGGPGDGRPDELTAKYAEGVDVFVTEIQSDTAGIMQQKYGLPPWLYNYTIDIEGSALKLL